MSSKTNLPKTVPKTPSKSSDNKSPSKSSVKHAGGTSPPHGARVKVEDDPFGMKPDFIYGGPFINVENICPFLDIMNPVNLPLQGTFKKSFAYFSLKERLPIILTKVIDYLSRESSKNAALDGEYKEMIQRINKLKSDLITNKPYDPFTYESDETEKWNEWLDNLDHKKYFMNSWVWTECYVYRKLREFCELSNNLKNFDPFVEQKNTAFDTGLEWMCIVAEKFVDMLPQSEERAKTKADFVTIVKLCLWANRCDMSLTLCEPASLKGLPEKPGDKKPPPPPPKKKKGAAPPPPTGPFYDMLDPLQMIIDLKDKVLADDSGKAFEQIMKRSNLLRGKIEANTAPKVKCSCHRLAKKAGIPLEEAPPSDAAPEAPPAPKEGADPAVPEPKPPCPTKLVLASRLFYDIVCDNVGYELFCDLCFAHFLIAQNIVQTIRFHVKKYPWFVSDVTTEDFNKMISKCMSASYNREVKPEMPKPKEGNLISEDYWTWPHVYKDMKKYDYWLYRRLQLSVGILFKGDLNYRKLLGDRNAHPYIKFEPSLQGFYPAPLLAVRTVKSEVVCGMPKGRYELLRGIDEKWMEKGEYGQIQFSKKAEKMKAADRPCQDYGETCYSVVCPVHPEL